MSLEDARAARERAEAELAEVHELAHDVYRLIGTMRALSAVVQARELRRLGAVASPSLNGTHGGTT